MNYARIFIPWRRQFSPHCVQHLSWTFALLLTEPTRKTQANTNAIEQLTFSTTGWSDWNWHRQTITSGLAFTVLCVLLSRWISATVTSDTNRKSHFSHSGTAHEVTSSSSSCTTLTLSNKQNYNVFFYFGVLNSPLNFFCIAVIICSLVNWYISGTIKSLWI